MKCIVKYFVDKNFVKHYQGTYPQSLNIIIVKFLGNILFKFDIISSEFDNIIINDGLGIKQEQNKICCIGSSFGWNEGIHEFKVKCINPRYDIIGITTNIKLFEQKNQWFYDYKKVISYSWYNGSKTFFMKDEITTLKVNAESLYGEWKKNDIISIKINFNQYKVSFYFNDNTIKDANFDLKKNLTYYPFICLNSYGDAQYQILT